MTNSGSDFHFRCQLRLRLFFSSLLNDLGHKCDDVIYSIGTDTVDFKAFAAIETASILFPKLLVGFLPCGLGIAAFIFQLFLVQFLSLLKVFWNQVPHVFGDRLLVFSSKGDGGHPPLCILGEWAFEHHTALYQAVSPAPQGDF